MKIIEISGNEFLTKEEFHDLIKIRLGLPKYYGKNLDALWDCLLDKMDTSIELHWEKFSDSKKHLGDYCDKIVEVFQDAEKELEGFKLFLE